MNNKNLTKKQVAALQDIRSKLQRGIDYLNQDDIVGIATATTLERANGFDYILKNQDIEERPKAITPMNKRVGSDIAGLYQALDRLNTFLGLDQR